MWIINCFLLVVGTACAAAGLNFFNNNKDAAGNIRFYIFSYGFCSSVWCCSYGLIGFCGDFELCETFRKIGVAAIDAFVVTEVFLATEMSGIKRQLSKVFRIASLILSVVDFFMLSNSSMDIFVRVDDWTTWFGSPGAKFYRNVHSAYMAISFVLLLSLWIAWNNNTKIKRLRRFLFMALVSNCSLIVFMIPDAIMPSFGIPAIPTSGIGGAACTLVMWYGATKLSSFDIRVGKLRDKLFDFIDAGIVIFDMKHEISLVNRYSRELAESNGGPGKHLGDLFNVDEETGRKMFAESEDNIYSVRLWNPGGTKAYALRMSAAKDDYGDTYCYICVFVEITEEVEAVSRFEIASRAKSRFLAQMSHEIRTPINAVLGMNEMILRRSRDGEILEYAENISSAGNTLLSLINSILDFSKIEDGKMDIVPVRYDTASFINDLVNSIKQRAEAKGLEFKLDIDENLPCEMTGDDVRFSQVIMNLLTNAVKYTERGSVKLTIRTESRSGRKVRIFVSVEDTGIGIREEDKKRLFESFERLDEDKNHNIEGTGLGISIVTNLLELMGSEIRLKSEYGKGSVFYFVLEQEIANSVPVGDYVKRVRENAKHRSKEEVISAPYARVLLVDDNAMNLKVANNLMKLCDIKPDMASSGTEAIGYMRRKEYDIVFLDHMMPGLDGIETLKKLKEEKLVPEFTTMIALTANAVVGARETYIAAGFTDYLSKPVELPELIDKLGIYLPQSAYRKEEDPATAAAEGGYTLIEFSDEEEDAQAGYDKDALSAAGVDIVTGLRYCAENDDLFFDMLGDFVSGGDKRAADIEGFYKEKNWREYQIKVHALKSNARTIGLTELSELARKLEEAAKSGEEAFIDEQHPLLMERFRRSVDDIGNCAV